MKRYIFFVVFLMITPLANAQNEITSISGATTPTYDANGNMTGDEVGRTLVYDAWNRPVSAASGSISYTYDGLGRRVTSSPFTHGTITSEFGLLCGFGR